MKTLYVGHYREGSGWSHAATNLALAANSVGIDVVCRNIKLSNQDHEIAPAIVPLEQKSLKDIDYCIQHVLPHHMVGTEKFKKNIAYFVGESNTTRYTGWINHLRLMDEIWVPNTSLMKSISEDGIKTKIRVIPHAFDTTIYNNSHGLFKFGDLEHKFKFYYIGDFNSRKNIESIIRCFHSEFDRSEQVALVLKLKKYGMSPDGLTKHVEQLCNQIKESMRLYSKISHYHKEIIVCDDFDQKSIYALHNSCDCFVSPTRGEGWSIPAFEAMCFGKTPICSKEGGPLDFIDDHNINTGKLINGIYSVCNHKDSAFDDIFTGREEWFTPSDREIKQAMRYFYENRSNINREDGLKEGKRFSFHNVGKMIKDALNDQ